MGHKLHSRRGLKGLCVKEDDELGGDFPLVMDSLLEKYPNLYQTTQVNRSWRDIDIALPVGLTSVPHFFQSRY